MSDQSPAASEEAAETLAIVQGQPMASLPKDLYIPPDALEVILETFYDNIKQGTSITLTGFGGFYVQPKRPTWVFKFNPGQKLKAVFGWSSTYKGKV